MSDDAVIILDPVNANVIRDGLASGLRTFAGGNCTVSLMLMAVRTASVCALEPCGVTVMGSASSSPETFHFRILNKY